MSANRKVAVVTGSNKGIGYAIVKGLCEKFDGDVYLTSRDIQRGKIAVEKLKELGHNPLYHQLDITEKTSIDRFKEYLVKNHGGLDILVNNASVAYVFNKDPSKTYEQECEETINVNYFGTLAVCIALFPILRQNAKVVNMSSSAGFLRRIPSAEVRAKFSSTDLTVDALNGLMRKYIQDVKSNKYIEEGWGDSPYVVSKVGVSALTILQQKMFDTEVPNRNIAVNSVHPGFVDTDMTDHRGTLTPEQGAKAALWLALEAADVKGQYVWCDCQIVDWFGDSTPPKTLQ